MRSPRRLPAVVVVAATLSGSSAFLNPGLGLRMKNSSILSLLDNSTILSTGHTRPPFTTSFRNPFSILYKAPLSVEPPPGSTPPAFLKEVSSMPYIFFPEFIVSTKF